MSEIGFLVWKMSSMPADPLALVAICHQYGIRRLVVKVLDGRWKYNVPSGDRPLMDYIAILRANGIIVEAWGYHYPDEPGPQGDAIEERRQKLDFSTYHIDIEGEWSQPYGMPKAAKTMLAKLKIGGFEAFFCSYRFLSQHPQIPADAFMLHDAVDGASPQNYWALSHNPVEQLEACLAEYSRWSKPVYPMGPTFGASFRSGGDWVYWEPSVDELNDFRRACIEAQLGRIYYYSLDWILTHGRFDWLEAATGVNQTIPPPEPEPTPDLWTVANCAWLNGRSEPEVVNEPNWGNKIVTVRAGQKVENLHEDSGAWRHVGLGPIKAWMHGDYLDIA